jgi:short-subunit dehydrogenase
VKGVIHTIDAAVPFLRQTPGAHLVAMSSTSAEYGAPEHAVYSATKFFVRGLTEALNIEYRAHGIQVSAIYVAYVQTAMVFDAAVKPASIDRLGVKVTPQQVAETVWKAVHGNRVHWRIGLDARLINLAVRLLGAGAAPIFRLIMTR